ncbi:MAG: NAD-dependent epimerase/dehydratase family protein [Pseudotabrizicola sp.]|uniref:NAD-dependent epimerase/dehydratase family protein n=1 Tax=Pseudotabrizicola sp. TaxID=2939647 RepID=UPI0027282AE4|nr:NAD-dependent epimerase/dehydratase family protein [Pseudotabrizicola sp.]MDO8882848.1 NAD-dependent epimerase/dehydratase family protein [Pseudotabrizicola sp.]MDP2081692.1 NAD-dependent epimerase/dehydratase family protein [Pseudotabrizicola sp.]MDZ7574042.1 NAD-dependent epimerase/dehydratase family protein [Pseudotabrizicola sp.]
MTDKVLITGAAGFIGFHLARRLLADGWHVTGFDGMTNYYDPALKQARLDILQAQQGFAFELGMLEDPGRLTTLAEALRPDVIIHLAAQAGVRYSIDEPRSYVQSNLIGTHEVLEAARAHPPKHLLMASTSSAYGANTMMPYAETDQATHPMSFYAATKIANEAMAHSYAHLFGLPTTMFRFFTVYGPWGRPDMALFKFTKAILNGDPIDVYNHGNMQRDFTYVEDLVEGISRLIAAAPGTAKAGPSDSLSPVAPFRVVNIGNGAPEQLTDFIKAIEAATGREARQNLLPMQPGDVPATWADATLINALVGPLPRTDIRNGVARFVDWYRGWNAR